MTARSQLMYEVLRYTLITLEEEWGQIPFASLACSESTLEHWQIYDPRHMETAAFILDQNGMLLRHPDFNWNKEPHD